MYRIPDRPEPFCKYLSTCEEPLKNENQPAFAHKKDLQFIETVHSSKLTWKWRGAPLKTTILYTGPSMGFHVNLVKGNFLCCLSLLFSFRGWRFEATRMRTQAGNPKNSLEILSECKGLDVVITLFGIRCKIVVLGLRLGVRTGGPQSTAWIVDLEQPKP